MRKKNVLYISYDGMTDPLGQSQVIPYLQGLSKKGVSYTLMSFEKPDKYHKNGAYIQEILADSSIQWVPLKYHKFPPVLSTIFDVWLMHKKAKHLYKQHFFDIIHCRSYLSALVGLRIKKKYGTKFLFDMRGFWADERVEGGLWNLRNPLYKLIYHFFKRKEKEFLEQADYTISLAEDGKRAIHAWRHIKNNPVPIEVIPCCADLNLFNRNNIDFEKVRQLRKELSLQKDDFVLLYLGSLGTWYMLDEMLDFFKILIQYRTNARFLFVTKDDPRLILTLAQQKGIASSKLIITPVERKELPNYIALGKLSIFFIKPVFSKKASSPTKQGELMGMGIPIVCNEGIGDTAEITRHTSSGAIIADFNEDSYHEVCRNLEETLKVSSSTINSGAQKYYSLEKGVGYYLQVYEKLL